MDVDVRPGESALGTTSRKGGNIFVGSGHRANLSFARLRRLDLAGTVGGRMAGISMPFLYKYFDTSTALLTL
ncbi:MAG: hypothetical protein AABY49_10130 [Planctomycetota bacterium]